MGKTLAELALAFAGFALSGTPYVEAQPYNQETQQQTIKQKVPIPPAGEISRVEKEIRELYKEEYKLIDPPKKKAFGDKLLANGRESNDNAQKYVLLRDAANTLADLLELGSAFEAVKALGDSFDGYNALDTYDKYLAAAQKKARTKDDAGKVAEAYLQLADAAVKEKNYKVALGSAKSAETVGKKAGDTSLVEKASDLVKSIPDMEKEYSLVKKAEETLQLNPNDPEANAIVGKYKGFVDNDWDAALKYFSRGANGLGPIADQEILLRSAGMDNPDAVCLVADLWYEHSGKTSNALDKKRFATHAFELYQHAQAKATGLTKDKIDKRISELEKKVNPVNGTAKGGWINLLSICDPQKCAVAGRWEIINGQLVSDDSPCARIEFPYKVPSEYDFKIIFEKQNGSDAIMQMLSKSNKQFNWGMGHIRNTIFGFHTVEGKPVEANPTCTKRSGLESQRKYTSLVEVRNNSVRAYLDGTLICERKTDGSDLDTQQIFKLKSNNVLGVGSHKSSTIFYEISLREISGKGTKLR